MNKYGCQLCYISVEKGVIYLVHVTKNALSVLPAGYYSILNFTPEEGYLFVPPTWQDLTQGLFIVEI